MPNLRKSVATVGHMHDTACRPWAPDDLPLLWDTLDPQHESAIT